MGYLSDFESDVFISYAHYDDDIFATERQGWVSQLHSDLEKRVKGYLGAQAALWRDQEIRNNQEFEDVILRRLVKTATFLAVVSPSFVEREWCIRELQAFADTAAQSLGVRLEDNRLRIFKVEKLRVDPTILPPSLKTSEGYKFYQDYESSELRPVFGGDYFRRYFEKMDELARDIADVLRSLARKKASGSGVVPFPIEENATPITVYLAETTHELDEQASEIRRDLKRRGCIVLPTTDLPDNFEQLKAEAEDALKRSSFSIHLMGRSYGPVLEGANEKSKAWVQHDLAMARAKDPNFVRLVWLANADGPIDVQQTEFLRYLRDDPAAQTGSEFLQKKNLAELKSILETKIKAIQQQTTDRLKLPREGLGSDKSPRPSGRIGSPLRIYIICDLSDRTSSSLIALRRYLFNLGYEPILPSENDNASEALQEHNDNLTLCDVALIYYGQASERWLYAKLMDFRKVLSRRSEPVLAKAIYVAPPERSEKKDFATHEADVIWGTDPFTPDSLASLVNSLSGDPRASA